MNLFIDASALVKLYHKEDGSEQLTDFLNPTSTSRNRISFIANVIRL